MILIDTYDSDPSLFTQGFELNSKGELILGTGLYGESYIGSLDLDTGVYTPYDALNDAYFGEGLTHTPDNVWQLTWKEGIAFKRDLETYDVIDTVEYNGEGWGLAYDETRDILWQSNGSEYLTLRHPKTFSEIASISVGISGLNELEAVDGFVYANIWQKDLIVKIDPSTGDVVSKYDLGPLLKQHFSAKERRSMDVLNGIAHVEENQFYITGKLYPEVLLVAFD